MDSLTHEQLVAIKSAYIRLREKHPKLAKKLLTILEGRK